MIQSAMMFALGFFVCGLFGLMFLSAFARRTRRVAEQRLLKRLASHRGEFDSEIAALRAQHAVFARRLEREAGAMRDQATAFRLESDLKDHEVATARSELAAKAAELEEINHRTQDFQNERLAVERQLAESDSALRSARRALDSELDKRGRLQEAFDRAIGMVDGRLIEIRALRSESDQLRDIAETLRPGSTRAVSQVVPMDIDDPRLGELSAEIDRDRQYLDQPTAPAFPDPHLASLGQMPTGSEPLLAANDANVLPTAPATGEGVDAIQNAADNIRRLTDEVQSGLPPSDSNPTIGNRIDVPVPSIEPAVQSSVPEISVDPTAHNPDPQLVNGSTASAGPKRENRRRLLRRGHKRREPRFENQADPASLTDEQSPDAKFENAVKEIRALGQNGRRAPGE